MLIHAIMCYNIFQNISYNICYNIYVIIFVAIYVHTYMIRAGIAELSIRHYKRCAYGL